MKLINFILLVAGIYFLQFLILPLTNLGVNVFIPFALIYFTFENRLSRILGASIILDVYMGLPFPLMTIALALTLFAILFVRKFFSADTAVSKLLIFLPGALLVYWSLIYVSGVFLGFFWERYNIPFAIIFDGHLIFSVIYAILFGTGFYVIIRKLIPQGLSYDKEGIQGIHT